MRRTREAETDAPAREDFDLWEMEDEFRTMSLEEYIRATEDALRANCFYWFPPDKELRRERNLWFLRGFGYGLADYSDEAIQKVLPTLYSRLIVRFSLDSTGPVLDNKEVIQTVTAARDRALRLEEPIAE